MLRAMHCFADWLGEGKKDINIFKHTCLRKKCNLENPLQWNSMF